MYSAPPNTATPTGIPLKTPVAWSTGLCDCFYDVGSCCMTCWCPCFTFGRIAEIVDKGSSSCGTTGTLFALVNCVGCGGLYSFFYRSKMRQQYSLPGSPCGDFMLHCYCGPCALCQEYRELKNRGFDMSIELSEEELDEDDLLTRGDDIMSDVGSLDGCGNFVTTTDEEEWNDEDGDFPTGGRDPMWSYMDKDYYEEPKDHYERPQFIALQTIWENVVACRRAVKDFAIRE